MDLSDDIVEAISRQRQTEHEKYRSLKDSGQSVIGRVQLKEAEGNVLILFETGEPRGKYAFIVQVENLQDIGWRECQAIAIALSISKRGNRMTVPELHENVSRMKKEFRRSRGPIAQRGYQLVLICPGKSSVRPNSALVIRTTSLTIEGLHGVRLCCETFGRAEYEIYIDYKDARESLCELESQAIVDAMSLLEPGEKLDKEPFLEQLFQMRLRYEFVHPEFLSEGRRIRAIVHPTTVKNLAKVPDFLEEAHRRIRDRKDSSSTLQVDRTESYPGVSNCTRLSTHGLMTGHGGQAAVYKCSYKGFDAAIKIWHGVESGSSTWYKRELACLCKMGGHMNVVKAYDFFVDPSPAIVMEFVPGLNLLQYIRANGSLSSAQARHVACGIANGLDYLHCRGIVHRDIKSQNVMIRTGEPLVPVIVDLGHGGFLPDSGEDNTGQPRALCVSSSTLSSAADQRILGTFGYRAPELLRTPHLWSEQTDVYSFGVLVWEMLAGEMPFEEEAETETWNAIERKVMEGARPNLEKIAHADLDIRELVQRCWTATAESRPSMRTIRMSLSQADPILMFRTVLDEDGNDKITYNEFTKFASDFAPEISHHEYSAIFDGIDTDGNGTIGLDEFRDFWATVEHGDYTKALRNYKDTAGRDDPLQKFLRHHL